MITTQDIYWVSGLLEGEGAFCLSKKQTHHKTYRQPIISLIMTDRDVIERAAKIFGTNCIKGMLLPSGKTTWGTTVYGRKGIGWMQTIYGLMCQRRRQRIKEILDIWKSVPGSGRRNNLKDEQVQEIKQLIANRIWNLREIATKLKIPYHVIKHISCGRSYSKIKTWPTT